MTDLTRRRALRLGALATGATVAGCLDDPSAAEPRSGGNGEDAVDVTVVQYGTAGSIVDEDVTATASVADSAERARAILAPHEPDADHRDDVGAALEDVDYDRSVLALVTVAAPNTCYRALEIEDVAVEDGNLVGDVTAVHSGADGCGEAITYPAALVVATVPAGDDPPRSVAFTVTDGWEETTTVSATVDDPLSSDPADLPGFVRPETDPEPIDPLACPDDDFERLGQWFDEDDVRWGEAADDRGDPTLAMRVDARAVERGEAVTITSTNVSDRVLGTGNRQKFSLQVFTDEGWQDVRGHRTGREVAYTDEGVVHPPGGGFEWTLATTAADLDGVGHPDLEVCPGLPAGRYRFVYWEPTVAVAFDLVEAS